MSVHCDIILRWSATPAQLTAVGEALWRWCNRTDEDTSMYQRLNSQALADLIAGKLPAPSITPQQADRRGVHFRLRDEASPDRQATIDSLRRAMPTEGVQDIEVDGASWNSCGPLPAAASMN